MVRIFTSLAVIAVGIMIAALLVGLFLGDIHGKRDAETLRWASVHRLLGVAAGILVVLVNSIVVTYFIGTSRWCKEVVETYQLNPELVRRSVALKRRAFPWALSGMLVIIGVTALGGAADPATLRQGTEWWVMPHLIGAGGVGVHRIFVLQARGGDCGAPSGDQRHSGGGAAHSRGARIGGVKGSGEEQGSGFRR